MTQNFYSFPSRIPSLNSRIVSLGLIINLKKNNTEKKASIHPYILRRINNTSLLDGGGATEGKVPPAKIPAAIIGTIITITKQQSTSITPSTINDPARSNNATRNGKVIQKTTSRKFMVLTFFLSVATRLIIIIPFPTSHTNTK